MTFVRKYTNMRFEPAGMTDDPDLRIATSLVDYIFRRLAIDYLSVEERSDLGILTSEERKQPTLFPVVEESDFAYGDRRDDEVPATPSPEPKIVANNAAPRLISREIARDAPFCYQCGNVMQRAGSCYVCTSCGTTSGCS